MAILVIQDQADVRERIAFAIESTFGGEVYQAANSAEAMKALQTPPSSPVTLVVLDAGGKAGTEFDALQNINPKLPCVLCLDSRLPSAPKLKWEVLGTADSADLLKNLLTTLQKISAEGKVALGFQKRTSAKSKRSFFFRFARSGATFTFV